MKSQALERFGRVVGYICSEPVKSLILSNHSTSNMPKLNSISIRNIVDELNVSYFVSDIQRGYDWLQNPQEKKIEQLFDYLMRGYPIGSFLFWKLRKDEELNLQLYKFIENFDAENPHLEKILPTQIIDENLHIVLDGQQRLTSLYIGLKGSIRLEGDNPDQFDTRFLYLNLHHKPLDDDPDDGYQFEFKTPEQIKTDTSDALWFRVGMILTFQNDEEDIREYCQERCFSPADEDMVTDLYRAVAVDENIGFFEVTEKSLDKVLRILSFQMGEW